MSAVQLDLFSVINAAEAGPVGRKPMPVLTPEELRRFRSKIKAGDCGEYWDGPLNNNGYGRFTIYRNGATIRILAHRLAYSLATGTDPGPLVVRHGCDTPRCCTPSCLIVGTHADNIRDAVERNRMDLSGLHEYRAQRDAAMADRVASGVKKCCDCKTIKPLASFSRNRCNGDGHQSLCKACAKVREDARYSRIKQEQAGLSENERLELRNPGWRGRKMAQRRREAVAS